MRSWTRASSSSRRSGTAARTSGSCTRPAPRCRQQGHRRRVVLRQRQLPAAVLHDRRPTTRRSATRNAAGAPLPPTSGSLRRLSDESACLPLRSRGPTGVRRIRAGTPQRARSRSSVAEPAPSTRRRSTPRLRARRPSCSTTTARRTAVGSITVAGSPAITIPVVGDLRTPRERHPEPRSAPAGDDDLARPEPRPFPNTDRWADLVLQLVRNGGRPHAQAGHRRAGRLHPLDVPAREGRLRDSISGTSMASPHVAGRRRAAQAGSPDPAGLGVP